MLKQTASNDFWLRIQAVISHFNFQNVSAFARHIGLGRSENLYQIRRGNNGISRELADMICAVLPEISKGWLLTGEGRMMLGVPEQNAILDNLLKIPFYIVVPEDPAGQAPDTVLYCSREMGGNAEIATYYRGNALLPTYKSGSIMFLKKWEPGDEPIYGDVYYVRTANFSKFRVVRRGKNAGTVRLASYSPEKYDDMQIARDEIVGLYHVCGASII